MIEVSGDDTLLAVTKPMYFSHGFAAHDMDRKTKKQKKKLPPEGFYVLPTWASYNASVSFVYSCKHVVHKDLQQAQYRGVRVSWTLLASKLSNSLNQLIKNVKQNP